MGAIPEVDTTDVSFSRISGCTCPWHPFQFIAWGFLLYFAAIFYGLLLPMCLESWYLPGIVSTGVILVVHLVFHVITIAMDPAHVNVRTKYEQLGSHEVEGSFNRGKQRHVIEDQYCCLCEVNVGLTSKHCRACNKCIDNFDHHCKWLNNCIGARNYKLFIVTLVTALIDIIVVVVFAIFVFTAIFQDENNGNLLRPYYDFHRRSSPAMQTQSTDAQTSYTPSTTFQANINSTEAILGDHSQEYPNLDCTTNTEGCPSVSTNASGADFQMFGASVDKVVCQVIIMVTVVLGVITIGLLAHLLIFHIIIMYRGLTTYQWIQNSREKAERIASEKDIPAANYDANKNKAKNFQVAPAPTSRYKTESDLRTPRQGDADGCGGILGETARAVQESQRDSHRGSYHDSQRNEYSEESSPTMQIHIKHTDEKKRRKKKSSRNKKFNGHTNHAADDSNSLRMAIRSHTGVDSDASAKNVSDVAVSMSLQEPSTHARFQGLLESRTNHRKKFKNESTDSETEGSLTEVPVSSHSQFHNGLGEFSARLSSRSNLPPLTASPMSLRKQGRKKKRRIKKPVTETFHEEPEERLDMHTVGGSLRDGGNDERDNASPRGDPVPRLDLSSLNGGSDGEESPHDHSETTQI